MLSSVLNNQSMTTISRQHAVRKMHKYLLLLLIFDDRYQRWLLDCCFTHFNSLRFQLTERMTQLQSSLIRYDLDGEVNDQKSYLLILSIAHLDAIIIKTKLLIELSIISKSCQVSISSYSILNSTP